MRHKHTIEPNTCGEHPRVPTLVEHEHDYQDADHPHRWRVFLTLGNGVSEIDYQAMDLTP